MTTLYNAVTYCIDVVNTPFVKVASMVGLTKPFTASTESPLQYKKPRKIEEIKSQNFQLKKQEVELVIEKILDYLPSSDDKINMRAVCSSWQDIIERQPFFTPINCKQVDLTFDQIAKSNPEEILKNSFNFPANFKQRNVVFINFDPTFDAKQALFNPLLMNKINPPSLSKVLSNWTYSERIKFGYQFLKCVPLDTSYMDLTDEQYSKIKHVVSQKQENSLEVWIKVDSETGEISVKTVDKVQQIFKESTKFKSDKAKYSKKDKPTKSDQPEYMCVTTREILDKKHFPLKVVLEQTFSMEVSEAKTGDNNQYIPPELKIIPTDICIKPKIHETLIPHDKELNKKLFKFYSDLRKIVVKTEGTARARIKSQMLYDEQR